MSRPAPRYLTLRIPREPWPLLRALTVGGMLALAAVCWTKPTTGLPILWGLVVPALPLVWVLAPGLWRNVCPMASVNQLPRLTGLTRDLTLPPWLERHGFTIGMFVFFTMVSLRPSLLQTGGQASAVMLLVALVAAFVGGTIYRGKSGFCGSVCPLRPTQAVYSRAPGAAVEHAHCRPCVGCTTNCQDIIPAKSFLSDLASRDGRGDVRWVFAGLLPGFIYAFGDTPVGTAWGTSVVALGAWAFLSLGLLTAAESLTPIGRGRLTALWGAASLGLFYWTATTSVATAISSLAGVTIGDEAVWEARAVLGLVVAAWLGRSLRLATPAARPAAAPAAGSVARPAPVGLELPVIAPAAPAASAAPELQVTDSAPPDRRGLASAVDAAMAEVARAEPEFSQAEVPHGARPTEASAAPVIAGDPPVQIPDRRGPGRPDRTPTIIFWPDGSAVPVPPHEPTIAAAARSVGIDLPEGCGTGLCGCDPVYVVSGAASIAPAGEQERATLQRLGLPAHARLACAARVLGDVVISLEETAVEPAPVSAPAHVPAQPVLPAAPLHVEPAHAALPVRAEQRRPAPAQPTPAAASVHARAGSPASLEEVGRIVIVGNGVSGITAASHVRRLHPGYSIDVVSRSAHPFYNRIAIARLIHRPQGLEASS